MEHHITFGAWPDLIPFLDQASDWIFRGQEDHRPLRLQTSLDRAAQQLGEPPLSLEQRALREFKRRARLHGEQSLPLDSDLVEWLALMQHHGAPTRLLDFTRSIYVALFFAVQKAKTESHIWCFRRSALSRQLQLPWSGNTNTALGHLLEPQIYGQPSSPVPPAVICTEPHYLNRRIALQQGCFLMPFDVSRPLMDNLDSEATGLHINHNTNLSDSAAYLTQLNFFFIKIPHTQHSNIRRHLRRMNITAEHLFPGLDGLATSFWQEP